MRSVSRRFAISPRFSVGVCGPECRRYDRGDRFSTGDESTPASGADPWQDGSFISPPASFGVSRGRSAQTSGTSTVPRCGAIGNWVPIDVICRRGTAPGRPPRTSGHTARRRATSSGARTRLRRRWGDTGVPGARGRPAQNGGEISESPPAEDYWQRSRGERGLMLAWRGRPRGTCPRRSDVVGLGSHCRHRKDDEPLRRRRARHTAGWPVSPPVSVWGGRHAAVPLESAMQLKR